MTARKPPRDAPGKKGPSSETGPVPAPIPVPAPAPKAAPGADASARAAAAAPPPPVQQIGGYRVVAPLGRGSMGAVYRAVQLSLDRTVAIKILSPTLAQNPSYARRFEREALASARLNHPNIVAALDVGEEGGLRYLVMEFVPGRTVAQMLAEGSMDERRAVGIVIQVARALDHAHKSDIVHRDIKPANIIVTKEGVAKLGDLGLAKEVRADGSQTEEGLAMGTPFYVSPEQARGEKHIDTRTDIYALGATLYHMVTGRVPFSGPNPAVVMTKHINEPLVPPEEANPEVGRGVSQIIEKMMAKDPSERYQAPAELIADLQAWLEGRFVVTPTYQLRSRRRRRRFR